MSFTAYGDSITAGQGITLAQNYTTLLAQNYDVTVNNLGVSGDMAIDMSWKTFGVSPSDFTTIMIGTNDGYQYGNDAGKRAGFIKYLRSTAVLSAGTTIKAANNMNKVGSWTNQGTPDNLGAYTTTPNDTITTALKGTTIYIGRFMFYQYNTTFEVWIDNILVDTVTDNTAGYGPSGNGRPFATGVTRYTGLTNTVHTVKLVYKSGGLFMPEFIASNDGPFKKPVFISNVIKKKAAGYGNGDSEANAMAYSNDIATMVSELAVDGLKVYLVDNNSIIDPATDLGDVTHPNAAGHVKIYNTFKSKIDAYIVSLSSGGSTPPPVYNYPPAGHQVITGKTLDVNHNGSGGYTSITIT